MADSLNRIVPPSVSVDRSTELRRERSKNPGERRRRRDGAAEPAPEMPSEPAAEPPAEKDRDKGHHVDINV